MPRRRTDSNLERPSALARIGRSRTASLAKPVLYVVGAVFLLVAGGSGLVLDLEVEHVLDARGVTTTGTFTDTFCGKCATLPVVFTTRDGTLVTTDVPVSGDPSDETIVLRYDPEHPQTAHPANGVLADEVEGVLATLLGLGLLVGGALSYLDLRAPRRQAVRFVAAGPQPSHVRVLRR
jgi:hypothetical protein